MLILASLVIVGGSTRFRWAIAAASIPRRSGPAFQHYGHLRLTDVHGKVVRQVLA